jgi:leucyl aminopeptidase
LKALLSVEFEAKDLEQIHADLLVVGFAPEDRPLRHAAARADWRLCGALWSLVASKRLTGAPGEATLLSVSAGLRAPLLLALGLGPRASLDVEAWRELGRDAAARALGLRAQRAVLGLVADAADLGAQGSQALLCGAAMAVKTQGADLRLVIAGDGAAARFPELQSLSKNQLPAEIGLRFSSPQTDCTGP